MIKTQISLWKRKKLPKETPELARTVTVWKVFKCGVFSGLYFCPIRSRKKSVFRLFSRSVTRNKIWSQLYFSGKIWGGNVRWTTSVEHMFKQSSKNTKIKSSIRFVSKNQSIQFSLKSKFWSHQNHLWSTALLLSVNKK